MTEREKWILWEDEDRSPYMNMAIDELLLEKKLPMPLLRIYGWDRPSISIGYVQDYFAAPQKGCTIVRRPTGGGIVFHEKDLTYTVVVPSSHEINKLDRLESYHVFHRGALRALSKFGLEGALSQSKMAPVDRASMRCFSSPTRYDVVCGEKKYAGAAQRRGKNGILHQGSISLEASGGDRSALARELMAGIKNEFMVDFEKFVPEKEFIEKATILANEKYATEKWNIEKIWR